METGVIYKISSLKTRHFLFGSTINPKQRWRGYLGRLRTNVYNNPLLQNLYNKYGEDNFTFTIVQENIPVSILTEVENLWITSNCSKVDKNLGGMNFRDALRGNFSQESKDKMSKWQIGRKLSTSHIENIKKNHISKQPGYIAPMTGVQQDIQKQIDSSTQKIRVEQYSLKGDYIQTFNSQRDAAKFLGNRKYSCNISKCCNGKLKRAYNYIWKYGNKKM